MFAASRLLSRSLVVEQAGAVLQERREGGPSGVKHVTYRTVRDSWPVKLLALKLAYGSGLLLTTWCCGELAHPWLWGEVTRWPRNGEPTFTSHLATWDAAHYLYLSEEGYAKAVRSCAFYPLWPLLMRWAAPLAGGNHLFAGLALSNCLSLAAWVLLYARVRQRWGRRVAAWSLAYLVAFPGALFFQFSYTESLFLLLVVLLWWGLEDRRWGLVWVAAFLLPLTRAIGVFAVLPIAWYIARESGLTCRAWTRGRRKRGMGSAGCAKEPANHDYLVQPAQAQNQESGVRSDGQGSRTWNWGVRWVVLAAPLLGWGLYLGLMWSWTGNPFEGFVAQRSWGVHHLSNLWNAPSFVWGFFQPTHWHEFRGSLLDRVVFAVLLYTVPVLWRLDKGLLVWTYWLGVVPAMSGTFTSYTRFASCAFPVFLGLAAYLNAAQGIRKTQPNETDWQTASTLRTASKWALLAVFASLHIVLVWRHVNFNWAG